MKLCKMALLVLMLLPGLAFAGPNAGGVLLVHANTSLVYTSGTTSYCGQSGLAACALAVTNLPWDPQTTTVFYVIAAFPDTTQPRLKAITWGVEWDDSKLVILAHGSCADFDVADGGWPASGTGIGQSFTETETATLTELYWFAGYCYGAEVDTTTFRLMPHPRQGGRLADDGTPPTEDDLTSYGSLGFGEAGTLNCPSFGLDQELPGDLEIVLVPAEPVGGAIEPAPGSLLWIDGNPIGPRAEDPPYEVSVIGDSLQVINGYVVHHVSPRTQDPPQQGVPSVNFRVSVARDSAQQLSLSRQEIARIVADAFASDTPRIRSAVPGSDGSVLVTYQDGSEEDFELRDPRPAPPAGAGLRSDSDYFLQVLGSGESLVLLANNCQRVTVVPIARLPLILDAIARDRVTPLEDEDWRRAGLPWGVGATMHSPGPLYRINP